LQGQLLAEAAAQAELDNLRRRGMVTENTYQMLRRDLETAQQDLQQQLAQMETGAEALEQRRHRIRKHLLYEKKARLTTLWREGMLSDEAYQELNEKLDHEIADLHREPAPSAATNADADGVVAAAPNRTIG
jgi:uncharacterized membrane protein YheB (UPF0754 family)